MYATFVICKIYITHVRSRDVNLTDNKCSIYDKLHVYHFHPPMAWWAYYMPMLVWNRLRSLASSRCVLCGQCASRCICVYPYMYKISVVHLGVVYLVWVLARHMQFGHINPLPLLGIDKWSYFCVTMHKPSLCVHIDHPIGWKQGCACK